MANTSDIRNGLCINFNNDIYSVVEFLHVKPGKGSAFVRTKLKSMTTGRVLEHTFPAGHKIEDVRVERRNYQFIYQEGDLFNFMDNSTFEQISVPQSLISNPLLLKEGMIVDILFHAEEERVLNCELPQNVVLEVVYTEPGLKGDTATNTLKPAELETGAKVMVPLFVNQGDKIKVDTASNSYVERVKD
jgi:elongation factor P